MKRSKDQQPGLQIIVALLSAIAAILVAILGVWIKSPLFDELPGITGPHKPFHAPASRPTRSFNKTMDEELRKAWDELREGRIAYNPRSEMTQGETEEVVVRIAEDPKVDLRQGFREQPLIERLRTSGTMAAYLDGQSDEFTIRSVSSTQQALVGEYSGWIWEVTPLQSGEKSIHLKVVATIRLSNGANETKDVLVKNTRILVKVNPPWITKRFVAANWQWLLGSPLVAGTAIWGFSVLRRRFRKPRTAGFGRNL